MDDAIVVLENVYGLKWGKAGGGRTKGQGGQPDRGSTSLVGGGLLSGSSFEASSLPLLHPCYGRGNGVMIRHHADHPCSCQDFPGWKAGKRFGETGSGFERGPLELYHEALAMPAPLCLDFCPHYPAFFLLTGTYWNWIYGNEFISMGDVGEGI